MLDKCVAQPPRCMKFNSISKAKYSKLMDKKMCYGNSASCAIVKTYIWRTWSFTKIWCCAGPDSRQWPVCISSQQHHPRLQDLHHGPGRAYTRRHAFGKAVNAHAREDVWLWLHPEPGAACFAADLISQDLITAELFRDTLARPGLSEFLARAKWVLGAKRLWVLLPAWVRPSSEAEGKPPCFFYLLQFFWQSFLK